MGHDKYIEIIMELDDNKDFEIKKGKAKAISEKEIDKEYYNWVDKQKLSRDFDTALEERINKPLENGMLIVKNPDGSIRFDDRKLRYDRCDLTGKVPGIYLGPTHFNEHLATGIASVEDKQLYDYLTKKGFRDFNDKKAYFADVIGVNATVETIEGYILIFKRSEESRLYKNHWHVIGEHLDTDLKLFEEKNPTNYFKNMIHEQILLGLKDELGIIPKELKLTGLVRDILGPNFTYTAKTDETVDEILKSFKHAKETADHSGFQKLKLQKLVDLLITEKKIVPIAFGSLLLYLKDKDKKLYEKVKRESKN